MSAKPKAMTENELRESIQRYAPILKFHPDEIYNMCSVEAFLQHATLVAADGAPVVHPAVSQLPTTGARKDKRFWLELEDDFKPGDLSTATAYVHALWQPETNSTDLQFWFFYAYNGPGNAHIKSYAAGQVLHEGRVNVAPLGEHYGDWECFMIRIDNQSRMPTQAWLSQHKSGEMVFYPDLARLMMNFGADGGRPVVYSSRNGHAVYGQIASNHTEARTYGVPELAAVEFHLHNDTGAGASLDCAARYELVSADWLGVQEPRWLDYPYRWGPEGTKTQMDPAMLAKMLHAALGEAHGAAADYIEQLAGDLVASHVTDDLNGPTGPKQKGTWKGDY